jgi:uncharacterized UBP type Zn finger protein
MHWFLQHDDVQLDATGIPRVVNPCRTNQRHEESGNLVQAEQNCMACVMKKLVLHYWYRGNNVDTKKDSEVYPDPLETDDSILKSIYDISTRDPRFAQLVTFEDGSVEPVERQSDAEEWMNYCLDACQIACGDSVPNWTSGYRALFEFEFEERRFCNTCDTQIPRVASDPATSFKQPSIGFTDCLINRTNPGTVADAINAQMIELPTNGAGITRNCPTCGTNQLLTRRFRIDAAPEYMLVKFNPTFALTPSRKPLRKPGSKPPPPPPPPVMRKITRRAELPQINDKLDLTHCQVDTSGKLEYRLVAVLPHIGELESGHWIATVRNHPKWYNINDERVNPEKLAFALSNPEEIPADWNATEEERANNNAEFQVIVLMYARVR